MKLISRKHYGRFLRFVIFALSFAMLSSSFAAITYAAEEGAAVSVSYERFTATEIFVENAAATVRESGSVLISSAGDTPTLNMDITPRSASTSANAIRIVIKNLSSSNSLKIKYVFKNSAYISEYAETQTAIERSEQMREYIIPIKSPDTMTKLSLCFEGEGGVFGDLELVSIGAVSYYFDEGVYFGEQKESTYYRDKGLAMFTGSVAYDTIIQYPSAKVVLYRLKQNETIDDVRYVHPYVAECPISLDFSFSLNIESTAEACAKYFVAVLTEDNQILPISSEFYLTENISSEIEDDDEIKTGYKGIETGLYGFATENGSSVAFVDVFLDKLIGDGTNGYLYLLDNKKEYYFNRQYIGSIDKEIKSYKDAGTSFYLRFLIDAANSDKIEPRWRAGTPVRTEYVSMNADTDDMVDVLYSCADFLITRYSNEKYSRLLQGVIFGRSVDNADTYNYCGTVSIRDYSDILAHTYSIIKRAVDKSGRELDIVIPLSGEKMGCDELMTVEARESWYPSDILAECMLRALDRYGVDVSTLCFMLEKHTEAELPDIARSYMAESNYLEFSSMVSRLAETYEELSDEMIYCWFPSHNMSQSDLSALYVYHYSYLSCFSNVKAYVVSLFERDEYMDIGGTNSAKMAESIMAESLKHIYKYVDTYRHEDVSAMIFGSLGISDWREIIPEYLTPLMIKRNLIEEQLSYFSPDGTQGTYKMWDFGSANGTGGWEASVGCSSLSVYTPSSSIQRSLVAVFEENSFGTIGAERGGIVYNSEDLLQMEDISSISFDFCIWDEAFTAAGVSELFEVEVSVASNNATINYTGIVKGGESATVYADITDVTNIKNVRISIKSLDDNPSRSRFFVCFDNISLQSKTYDDDGLREMILSGELVSKENQVTPELKILIISSGVVAAGILTALTVKLIIFIKNKKSGARKRAL